MAAKNSFNQYIDMAEKYFMKLPALPKGGRNFIVTVLPWIALIFGALGTFGGVVALLSFSFISPVSYGILKNPGTGLVITVLGLISAIFLLMSFSGLKKSKEKGWKFIFYSETVSLISNIVLFNPGGVILNLVGFYFLYQVRSHYK